MKFYMQFMKTSPMLRSFIHPFMNTQNKKFHGHLVIQKKRSGAYLMIIK